MRYIQILIAMAVSLLMGSVFTSFPKVFAKEKELRTYKKANENNPISSQVFCADPTAVEYNGRLYVYGTNDHQQCREKGEDKDNTYEKIKSLVIFSTDDMVNWTYHGEINVGEIAPWIMNSWAPSVVSRKEDDGLTHFYLYFSNSGTGVGVITATDPLGPWTDPLGKPLIRYDTEGLENCPNPFDPGAVIDDSGVGWLSFGGGKASGGTDYMPGSSRIVKLGSDMLSFDSDFTEIPAPYFFEASELNFINGYYVYTYCSDWSKHIEKWEYPTDVPGGCAMISMKTRTPLDPSSWGMIGEVLKNPGEMGFDYSNNHTHMHKYKGKWYMLYHTLSLKNAMRIKGGYRSICADEIEVDEKNVTASGLGTKEGILTPSADSSVFAERSGAQICSQAGVSYDVSDPADPHAISDTSGAWIMFSRADMGDDSNPLGITAKIHGSGNVEIRLDSPDGTLVATVSENDDTSDLTQNISGLHDLYFVFSEKGMYIDSWCINKITEKQKVSTAAVAVIISAAAALIGVIVLIILHFRKKKN